jgi:hypothetical protein
MKKSEYAMLDPSTTSFDSKTFDQKLQDETNVISSEIESVSREEEAMEDMETYQTSQDFDFEVDEVKDCLEKTKKKRNYIEFRSDYEKR